MPSSNRRAEVDASGALLLHPEDDVDVALIIRGLRVGRRQRRLEEIQILNVLIAADQPVLVEHVARKDHELLANAGFVRVVVAEDLDPVHRGRRLLVDLPAEIHDRDRIAHRALHDGPHLRVDVAFVAVRVANARRRFVPRGLIERADVLVLAAEALRAVAA